MIFVKTDFLHKTNCFLLRLSAVIGQDTELDSAGLTPTDPRVRKASHYLLRKCPPRAVGHTVFSNMSMAKCASDWNVGSSWTLPTPWAGLALGRDLCCGCSAVPECIPGAEQHSSADVQVQRGDPCSREAPSPAIQNGSHTTVSAVLDLTGGTSGRFAPRRSH